MSRSISDKFCLRISQRDNTRWTSSFQFFTRMPIGIRLLTWSKLSSLVSKKKGEAVSTVLTAMTGKFRRLIPEGQDLLLIKSKDLSQPKRLVAHRWAQLALKMACPHCTSQETWDRLKAYFLKISRLLMSPCYSKTSLELLDLINQPLERSRQMGSGRLRLMKSLISSKTMTFRSSQVESDKEEKTSCLKLSQSHFSLQMCLRDSMQRKFLHWLKAQCIANCLNCRSKINLGRTFYHHTSLIGSKPHKSSKFYRPSTYKREVGWKRMHSKSSEWLKKSG